MTKTHLRASKGLGEAFQQYWRFSEKPFPKTVWWKVVVPKNCKLSVLQEYDLVFDEKDLRKRQLKLEDVRQISVR